MLAPYRRHLALIMSLLFLEVAGARASTWRVERDGSGDYTDIPTAIAAASVGDTIRIGPGQFTETVPFVFAPPSYTTDVYVPVSVDSLTIIGSGNDQTTIGPTSPNFVGEGPKGVVAPQGITFLEVRDLSIENVKHGVFLTGKCDIINLRLQGCQIGAWEFTVGAQVDSCEFMTNEYGIISNTGCADLTISDCTFTENSLGVGINSTTNVIIDSSYFENSGASATAIQYSESSSGRVTACKISDVGDGVAIRSQSDVTLQANSIQAIYIGLNVFDGSIARGSRNVFRGDDSAVAFQTTSTAYLSENHILKSNGWAAWCKGFNLYLVDIDLRNNYWGTDSADSISAWIFDGNDPQDPFYETNLSNVLYEPFSPVPVEAEKSSVGSLKSQFLRK